MGQALNDAAIDDFAKQMKAKMQVCEKRGRSGWSDKDQCRDIALATLLVMELQRPNGGSFIDIANFAMMLHQREASPEVLFTALMRSK